MIYLLSKHPDLKIVTERDFKMAFTNSWFVYGKALIHLMPGDSLKSFISTEIFHLAMTHTDAKLLKSMFIKASSDVQQSIIEDLLQHFATNGKYDAFVKVLETKIIEPKLFANGETLFTSLLKEKNVNYCWEIIRSGANKNCLNKANNLRQTPLQIAIEMDLYDLICPLIFQCDQLNNEDTEGNTALKQLFQKLSLITDASTDEKLKTAVKTIIVRGGDIYKATSTGRINIEFCSRGPLRTEIEAFENIERNRNAQQTGERVETNICNICFDRKLDCAFDCGHTFCMTCGMELFRCPMCNAESTNPRKVYIT